MQRFNSNCSVFMVSFQGNRFHEGQQAVNRIIFFIVFNVLFDFFQRSFIFRNPVTELLDFRLGRANFRCNFCNISIRIFHLRTCISDIAIQRRNLLPDGFIGYIFCLAFFKRSLLFAIILCGTFEIFLSFGESLLALAELRFHVFKISTHRIELCIRRFHFLSAQCAFQLFAVRFKFSFGAFCSYEQPLGRVQMRFNAMQSFEPSANIAEAFFFMSERILLRSRLFNFFAQCIKFFFAQHRDIAKPIFDVLDSPVCIGIQVMDRHCNFSVNAIARQLFKDRSAFVLVALQELVELTLSKHHRLSELPKIKPNHASHRRFDFTLIRRRNFHVLRCFVLKHPSILLELIRSYRAVLVPAR